MSGLRKAVLVATTSLVLIAAGASGASASSTPPLPQPLQGIVDQLNAAATQVGSGTQVPGQTGSSGTPTSGSSPSGTATSTPTNSGISQPKSPDHSSSHVLHGQLLPDQSTNPPLTADAGSTTSTVNDDNSSSADATLLALGGMTIYGSQASSSGANDSHGPTEPVCTNSNGAVCPLVADSHASETSTSSDSSSKTSAASICLTPPSQFPLPLPSTGSKACPAGLGLQALSSESTMHRDKTTGETSGSTSSSLGSLCVPGAPNGGCAGLITSQGSADSNGKTDRSSALVNFFGMDTPLTDPQGTPESVCHPQSPIDLSALQAIPGLSSIPKTTTTGICAYVNQGQTFLGSGFAAVSQTALSGNLLGLVSYDVGHSEVLAHQVAVPAVVSPPVTSVQPPATTTTTTPAVHHTSVAQAVAGVLPHTGGIWSGWLAIGLLMLAAGSAMAARDLRRGRVTG